MATNVIILAAGKGKRMKSNLPKPLHTIFGTPIIDYIIQVVSPLTKTKPVLVVGHESDRLKDHLGDSVSFVEQAELLGTGHAVQQAESILADQPGQILVVYGDMPLLRQETLETILNTHQENNSPLTILTVESDQPRGFGRILRDENDRIIKIVEETDATPEQLNITELNAGIYCFQSDWLWPALQEVEISPKGEYYLTDLVELAARGGFSIPSVLAEDKKELIGINTKVHLAEASQIMKERINRKWMMAGVSIIDPNNTYIEPGVTVGKDSTILPSTYLQGSTKIGSECLIGPETRIMDSQIGDSCEIEFSVIEESKIENNVDVGPYSHLRKGTHLASGVHVGNFGEIKNSYLGEGTKMGHFSYVGDAQIGKNVNIGAGTITCNYDGVNKHKTVIKDGAFIGSDSMLVAPLEIGENATTGAGSVVTKDVPPDTVVVGIPARQISKKKKSDQ